MESIEADAPPSPTGETEKLAREEPPVCSGSKLQPEEAEEECALSPFPFLYLALQWAPPNIYLPFTSGFF